MLCLISLLYSFSFLHAGKENISNWHQCYYKVSQSVASNLLIILVFEIASCSFIPLVARLPDFGLTLLFVCVKFLFAVLQCSAFIYMCLSLVETLHPRNWSHLPALHDEIIKVMLAYRMWRDIICYFSVKWTKVVSLFSQDTFGGRSAKRCQCDYCIRLLGI